jgi:hypothetical protein
MKYLRLRIYQVCSNKSPWFKIGPGPGAYIQVSDFRAIMAILFIKSCKVHLNTKKQYTSFSMFTRDKKFTISHQSKDKMEE